MLIMSHIFLCQCLEKKNVSISLNATKKIYIFLVLSEKKTTDYIAII